MGNKELIIEKELTKQGQVGKNDQTSWLLNLDNESGFHTQIMNCRTVTRSSELFPGKAWLLTFVMSVTFIDVLFMYLFVGLCR